MDFFGARGLYVVTMDDEAVERLASRVAEKAAEKAADLAAQKAVQALLPQVHILANNAAAAAIAPIQLQIDQQGPVTLDLVGPPRLPALQEEVEAPLATVSILTAATT